jgi:butyryl-CoA dehydrogenase
LGVKILEQEIKRDLSAITTPESAQMAKKLGAYLVKLHQLLTHVATTLQSDKQVTLSANAQAMMNAFATIVVSWIWIRQASVAEKLVSSADSDSAKAFYLGKVQAAKYFLDWELPSIERDLQLLHNDNDVCAQMQPDWF